MSPAVEEILYPALEDYEVDIVIGQGPSARTVKMRLERFTLIGATTRTGLLTSPLRSRFGISHRLEFYTPADLEEIVRRSARILDVPIDDAAAAEIARRARGTPRIVNRLLRRVRDYAQVRADGTITLDVAHAGLKLLEVDEHGFDEIDRKLLRTIIDKFGGGPVGLNTIAAAISEEKDAIEDIYEPFLIQIGFLDRTPRGRVATPRAYGYFGLDAPERRTKGLTTVVTRRATALARRRTADDDHVAGDLRAAARADQRRSREDGRHDRRVDHAARSASASATSSIRAWRRRTSARRRRSRRSRDAGLTPDDIGVIVVGTVTPDMMFPSTACLIQHKIGARHAWGFDLSAACSAFTYSLTTREPARGDGRARPRAGGRRRRDVEHHRLHGSVDLRAVRRRRRRGRGLGRPATGDGAILDFEHEIDGSGGAGAVHAGRRQPAAAVARDGRSAAALREAGRADRLQVRRPQDRRDRAPHARPQRPDSRPISICSCRIRPTAASSRRRRRTSSVDPDKVVINIERFGNTTAATIPLALNDAVASGRLKKGDLVLLASVGAG